MCDNYDGVAFFFGFTDATNFCSCQLGKCVACGQCTLHIEHFTRLLELKAKECHKTQFFSRLSFSYVWVRLSWPVRFNEPKLFGLRCRLHVTKTDPYNKYIYICTGYIKKKQIDTHKYICIFYSNPNIMCKILKSVCNVQSKPHPHLHNACERIVYCIFVCMSFWFKMKLYPFA